MIGISIFISPKLWDWKPCYAVRHDGMIIFSFLMFEVYAVGPHNIDKVY